MKPLAEYKTPLTDRLSDRLRSYKGAGNPPNAMQLHACRLEQANAAMREAFKSIARYPMQRDDELTLETARAMVRKTLAAVEAHLKEGK
jgi:chromosomal replication initiation ATPase DnaA